MAVVASDQSTPVRLTMRERRLELNATAQDVGNASEELDAKYEGTELTVAFNPDYLVKGIEAVHRRRGHPRDRSTPSSRRCCARSTRTDFLYLLMPVRVS